MSVPTVAAVPTSSVPPMEKQPPEQPFDPIQSLMQQLTKMQAPSQEQLLVINRHHRFQFYIAVFQYCSVIFVTPGPQQEISFGNEIDLLGYHSET